MAAEQAVIELRRGGGEGAAPTAAARALPGGSPWRQRPWRSGSDGESERKGREGERGMELSAGQRLAAARLGQGVPDAWSRGGDHGNHVSPLGPTVEHLGPKSEVAAHLMNYKTH